MHLRWALWSTNPMFARLLPLGYALLALVALVLFLTWAALQGQTALAGTLNGESMWSKASNRATFNLLAYAVSGNEADYAGFEHNYAVVLAYNQARDEAVSGRGDDARIADLLRRAYMLPVAVPNITFLFRHFARAPYMREALATWAEADPAVAELGQIADRLHRDHAFGQVDHARVDAELQHINAINELVQGTTKRFSAIVANASLAFARAVSIGVAFFVIAALLMWGWLARRVLLRIHADQARYRRLFDATADAIIMVDEDSGRIIEANPAAGLWVGRKPRALRGESCVGLFARHLPPDPLQGDNELQADDGSRRPVEIQSHLAQLDGKTVRQVIIHDMSARAAHEREVRTAADALASIAEGVIIADPGWRVVSANPAASRLTGFTPERLLTMSLCDTRAGGDDSPSMSDVQALVAASGRWSGQMRSRRADGSMYIEMLSITAMRDAGQKTRYYVAVFSDTSAAEAQRRRLEHVATHDALTGLVNRREFERECQAVLENARATGTTVAVLFIDLDGFKVVNDSYGHAIGDRLLVPVGERILSQLRKGDMAGRAGGDEFTVLVPHVAQAEDAASLARRLCTALAAPFRVDTFEIAVTASVGVALSAPDTATAASLIADADAAMYVAKVEERNTWRFHTTAVRADVSRRRMLATEMRRALDCGEFHLVYQPIIDMATGRLVAVEALLRWQHPERGVIMPGDFIPVAESMGLIRPIDEWVMGAVCAQISAWDSAGLAPVRIGVNVSARWFGHGDFMAVVRETLRISGIAPPRLVLEITEGAVLRMGKDTDHTLRALEALGIGIAIDDFGTGYASMAYLKLPAVAYLKIDRSFVTNLPDDANDAVIARAVVAMAQALGLVTIAEGIETAGQRDFLQAAGCVLGQGYLYSRPQPPDAIAAMLGGLHFDATAPG